MGGLINIFVEARPNTLPSINDISILSSNRITTPITMSHFLVEGGYSDSEGDPIGIVKIDSLPSTGTLIYGAGNANVSINQEFTNAEITNEVLKYRPIETDNLTNGNFNFKISDNVDLGNFTTAKSFNIGVPEPPTYGNGTISNTDLTVFQNDSIQFNWNRRDLNNYLDFNLGLLRQDDPYINSPIYTGPPANKIVIESFTDDVIATNQTIPNFWNNFTVWSPPASGVNQKQILDAGNTPITLPYTINLPGGNTPISNIGLKINLIAGEVLTPTTVGSPYSSFTTSVRRLIIGYKIYSGNVAQTPTIYHMWYRALIKP